MKKQHIAICGVLAVLIAGLLSCGQPPQPQESRSQGEEEAQPSDWFFRQRAYPYGQINQAVYLEAVKAKQRAERQQATRSNMPSWAFKGPMNVGGRIASLAVHPSFPDTLFIGAASGGVFRSYDRGQTFEPILDDALSLAIGDLDIAPSDPQTLYVGTGEANAGGGSIAYDGAGLYKSTNGGDSFTYIGLPQSGSIGRIAVHPSNPDHAYVAAMGKLYAPNPERGIYRTTDGGQTWEQVLYLNDSTGGIDLAIHPYHPDTLYAALWERVRRPDYYKYGGDGSGVYRSYDGGDTWEQLSGGLPGGENGRIGLALSPSSPNTLYAQYISPFGDDFEVYRSNDGGDTWSPTGTNGATGPSFMWWFGRMFPHPTDAETVFLPSLPMYRTTDGGQNWEAVTPGVHVDQHDLYIDPNNPDYMVLGNDGGLYISEDGAQSWSHRESLPITQFYTCEIDYSNPLRRYGGTQDNGTVRTTSGGISNWQAIWSGDGFYCLVDPEDNQFVYLESQNGRLRRSVNGGTSFQSALAGIFSSDRRNWSTPVAMNPQNPRSLYYGTFRVYKSVNRAVFWQPISEDLTGGETGDNLTYGTITSIAVSPVDTQIIYTGSDNGRVWRTSDGGSTWSDISAGLPNRWVTRVAAAPDDPLTVYVTFSGYRFDDYLPHVFKSTDGGQTWQDISAGLPEVPVNEIVVDPDRPERLYLGNDLGAYVSFNGGLSWHALGQGLPPVVVSDLCLHLPSLELYAGTYGRSMYSLDLASLEPPASLSGQIRAAVQPDEGPMGGVALELLPDGTATTTNAQGLFSLDVPPPGSSLRPSKDGDDTNGVSTLDLILINRHILGVEPLPSPFHLLAADVNLTGSITTLDLIQIRKLILGINTEFPAQESWRFVREDEGAEGLIHSPFPITEEDLANGAITGIKGVKVGDVSGDALY